MKTVLIVEDEKLIRQGLAAMVKRAPVPVEKVLEARNGAEALEILQKEPADVMITDVRMPEMDGMELVHRAAVLPQPPLSLVISGYDDFNYAVTMLRGGVRDYLLKPVERQKLYDALQKLEDEISEAQSRLQNARQLQDQALRCLMADKQLGEGERANLIARYSRTFPAGEYRVICMHRPADETAENWIAIEEGLSACCVCAEDADRVREKITGNAGISAAHTGLQTVDAAWSEALEAFKCGFFADRAGPGEYEFHAWSVKTCPHTELAKLLQLMAASRWQDAVSGIEKQFSAVRAGSLAPDAAGTLVQDFGRQLAETYRTMLLVEEDVQNLFRPWQYASAGSFLEAIRSWLAAFSDRLARECDDYQNKQKIRDAVKYVQENFTEPLNMTIVSNQVSMNYSLFSLLFKQYVGTNFVAYLQKQRVDAACRLLRETEMHANEIGRRVGFADEKNFLKVFKTHCGLSPTEYRKAQQTPQAVENLHGGENL